MPRIPLSRYLRRPKCCTFAMVIVIIIVMLVWKVLDGYHCESADSLQILQELCQDYKDDKVTGNLCPHICDMHTIWFNSCVNYKGGKLVFKMKWMDEIIIFKSKKARLDDYDKIENIYSLSDIMSLVADSLVMNLPIDRAEMGNDELLRNIWMDDVDKYITRAQVDEGEDLLWSQKAISSLWPLVQQDEYILMKYYATSEIFPKMFGSCGHFYAMENMPPGSMLSVPSFQEVSRIFGHSWKDRATIALKLLHLVEKMDTEFTEVLNMCDMKGENFGISSKGRISAIDVDMALFDKKLKDDLKYPNCTKHEDCSFFDCQGWCDVPNQRCTDILLNNNLQRLCQRIFSNQAENVYTGLLRSAPLHKIPELPVILRDCASPAPSLKVLPGCSAEGRTVKCPSTFDKIVRYSANVKYFGILKDLINKGMSS